MGRRLQMVPPNWEHPKERGEYVVMNISQSADEAWAEWQKEYVEWLNGEHDRIIAKYGAEGYPKDEPYRAFCAWHGQPPDPKYYRPHWPEGWATWFQVYETVSEGTPVTPPFATREELVEYLVANGDFWDQKRRKEGRSGMPCAPWDRLEAQRFVFGDGWAPSMVVHSKKDGIVIATVGHGFPTSDD